MTDQPITEVGGGDPADEGVAPREFYDRPHTDQLGDPREDPPGTMRIETGDREARYNPDTPRVLRLPDNECGHRWVGISGPYAGMTYTDHELTGWPITHWASGYTVAMAKTRGPLQPGRAAGTQRHERGDMDLEGAFRDA